LYSLAFLFAFFLPLSFYVLVLGIINRRSHPLMVSGPWDFIGILFAASGFLAFDGPFIISTLNDNFRTFLLWGPGGNSGWKSGDALWVVWLILSALYFVAVLGGAAFMFRLQRKQTAIYNIDRETFAATLAEVCQSLGLRYSHSGTSYLFESVKAVGSEAIALEPTPGQQRVFVDVDFFRPMRHVTLRWNSVDAPLRKEIEEELARKFEETVVMPSDLGGWLTVLAFVLLATSFLIGFAILVARIFNRV
jgi:hypothetical protein